MRFLRLALFVVIGTFNSFFSFAQSAADPTSWTYELQKKGDKEYELVFKLQLSEGWHIWSVTPGGDGFQIAPSFTLDKNPAVKLKGKVKETGHATTTAMEGIDGKVTYYSGTVIYTQAVTVSGPVTITGRQEYQVCNDRMCLPPRKKNFSFEVK